jgi:hypothetical protein
MIDYSWREVKLGLISPPSVDSRCWGSGPGRRVWRP